YFLQVLISNISLSMLRPIEILAQCFTALADEQILVKSCALGKAMDRDVIRGMAEDYWRAAIPLIQSRELDVAQELGQKFEQRIQSVANSLPPLESAAFLQAMDAERENLIAEYKSNPYALKKRLGTPLGRDQSSESFQANRRSDLGDLVVRTAVRATVWDTIW